MLDDTPEELRVRAEREASAFVFDEDVPRFVVTDEERFEELLRTVLLVPSLVVEEGLELTFSLVLEVVDTPSPLNEVLRLESLLRTEELLSPEDDLEDRLLPADISERDPDEREPAA